MLDQKTVQKIAQIPGWLSAEEGALLYYFGSTLADKGVIVEIGSFQGKSTIYLGLASKESRRPVFAIDPHQGQTHWGKKEFAPTLTAFRKHIHQFRLDTIVTAVPQTSESAVRGWKRPVALLHVDGLHEYRAVKKDLRSWLSQLIDTAVIVCHDAFTPEPGVFQAILEEIFPLKNLRAVGALDSQIYVRLGEPTLWERVNVARSKFFLTLAAQLWQNSPLPYPLRFLLVNRFLKLFFLNRFILAELQQRYFA